MTRSRSASRHCPLPPPSRLEPAYLQPPYLADLIIFRHDGTRQAEQFSQKLRLVRIFSTRREPPSFQRVPVWQPDVSKACGFVWLSGIFHADGHMHGLSVNCRLRSADIVFPKGGKPVLFFPPDVLMLTWAPSALILVQIQSLLRSLEMIYLLFQSEECMFFPVRVWVSTRHSI